MNRKDSLGMAVNRCLNRRAESLEVTSSDTERMRRLVHTKIEEEPRMKRWSAKRVIVTVAVICALSTVTAIAAGKVAYTSSSSSHNDKFSYGQIGEMAQKAGVAAKTPETFSNGYTFDYGVPVHNEAMDEERNVIRTAESLNLFYKKDGMPFISVDVNGTALYDGEEPADETFSHGEITLKYSCDQYRFVPPDYQISQEEQEKMDAGELYVSYGSDKVQDSRIQSVSWTDGSDRYIMMTMDSAMTAEELVQMAGEIIDNR